MSSTESSISTFYIKYWFYFATNIFAFLIFNVDHFCSFMCFAETALTTSHIKCTGYIAANIFAFLSSYINHISSFMFAAE